MWIVKVWRKIWNPDFYVCTYRIKGLEAGRFAALGETRSEALEDARSYVERRFSGDADYSMQLHRPTLYQRINAALRST